MLTNKAASAHTDNINMYTYYQHVYLLSTCIPTINIYTYNQHVYVQFWYDDQQLSATLPTVSPLSDDFVDGVHYVTFYPSYRW